MVINVGCSLEGCGVENQAMIVLKLVNCERLRNSFRRDENLENCSYVICSDILEVC